MTITPKTTTPTPKPHTPPKLGAPGFGRDTDLEEDRARDRPAGADLNSNESKAEREPILGPGLDPDLNPGIVKP
jgi:hypothetical protein